MERQFSNKELETLNKYVTSVDSNIFGLKNLPEVVKGALFSRYSRSTLCLKSLLLKEFLKNDFVYDLNACNHNFTQDGDVLTQKAQNFYNRILDGYGDDSIGELGGAHLALENISMLAAKHLQDARLGGSPLEKSTRYVYFDQKIDGEYAFYKDPVLLTSAYKGIYLKTANMLFDTYSELIPCLVTVFEEKFPRAHNVSEMAYKMSIRAKALDVARGLLPASTLVNVGLYGNGRFFETLIKKLHVSNFSELRDIGGQAQKELSKLIPSFIRRAMQSHTYQQQFASFVDETNGALYRFYKQEEEAFSPLKDFGVHLVDYDKDAIKKVVAHMFFASGNGSLSSLYKWADSLSAEKILTIFDTMASLRDNRRHKMPRALEVANFTFEILADFGTYRDLQRHRVLTQERQLLSCNFGYHFPEILEGTPMGKKYKNAMDEAKATFDVIVKELPEEAQYIVPQAFNIHWYMHVNLRELQWICELRSGASGHPAYRFIAQEIAKQIFTTFPEFKPFFKFVDFSGYDLGRLQESERIFLKAGEKDV